MNEKYAAKKLPIVSSEDYSPAQKQDIGNLEKALGIELKPLKWNFGLLYTNEGSVGRTSEELLTYYIHTKRRHLFDFGKRIALLRGPDKNGVVVIDVWDESSRKEVGELAEKLKTGLELDFLFVESITDIKKRVIKSQEHYERNIWVVEKILKNERGYVSRKFDNEDVIVLCSGGLDSSVMINFIIEEYNAKVHPLFIKRGARAEKFEEQSFDFFMDFYNKRFPENMKEGKILDYEVPPTELKEKFPIALMLTQGHPLRNSTLQNLGVMYAVSLDTEGKNVRTILTGSIADDNTEPELGLLSLRTQTLNTCINMGDWAWQITSPLTDTELVEKPISKVQLIKYAIEKKIPLEKTRTCFSEYEIADGTCFACRKRLKAFEYAGIEDKLKYMEAK